MQTQSTSDIDLKRKLNPGAKAKITEEMKQSLKELQLDPVWLCPLQRGYTVNNVLGSGAFGVVVAAQSKNARRRVAIKHIVVKDDEHYCMIKVLRELNILQHLNSSITKRDGMKNFYTGLLEAFCPDAEMERKRVKNIFLVMRFSDFNLAQVLQKKSSSLSLSHIKVILYNLLCSLSYLHSCNIVHRDLKP